MTPKKTTHQTRTVTYRWDHDGAENVIREAVTAYLKQHEDIPDGIKLDVTLDCGFDGYLHAIEVSYSESSHEEED